MAVSFRLLLTGVIVVGLVMGVGLGAWQNGGKVSPTAHIQGINAQMPTAEAGIQNIGQATPDATGQTMVFGTLQTVAGTLMTLSSTAGAIEVNLAEGVTVYRAAAEAAAIDVTVGQAVNAVGSVDNNNNLVATAIDVGPAAVLLGGQMQRFGPSLSDAVATGQAQQGQGRGQSGAGVASSSATRTKPEVRWTGLIESATASEVIIRTDDGSKRILLNEQTRIRGIVAGDLADLEVGMSVMVVGKSGADGKLEASIVRLVDTAVVPEASK